MVSKRKRSLYRKSKKKLGFRGLQKQECEDKEILRNQTENVSYDATQSSSETDPDATETVPLCASRRKLSQHEAQYEPNENENTNLEPPEHQFVDMQRLQLLSLICTNVKMVSSCLFLSTYLWFWQSFNSF